MPHYIKTGYWALEKNGYKGWLNLEDIIGGGGSSPAVNVTKAQVDALIASNGLVPGQTYIISGVDVPLYGGTTVILQADTTNKLALAGHGIFYNPKYINSQATPDNGYGVWESTNTYAIGDDAIWGGKHWTNTSGSAGSSVDKYTLSAADWTEVPFNDVDYNVAVDIIHYDYTHDMIIRRKDKWDNDVDGNYGIFEEFISGYAYGNPIKDFQWGNGNEDFNTLDYYSIGVQSNYVKDSYLECINFIGSNLQENNLTSRSYIEGNTFYRTSIISQNSLNADSSISNNQLKDYCYIRFNLLNSGFIDNNVLNSSNVINKNLVLNGSSISYNILNNVSKIENNSLSDNSFIANNTLTGFNSKFYYNTVSGASYINSNTLENVAFNYNTLLSASAIQYNESTGGASGGMFYNTLSSSYIENNQFRTTFFQFNTLSNNTTFNFGSSGVLVSKSIARIEANGANATFNISAATIIFASTYSKQLFKNSAGTTRLGYYNASDVFTVVNVNA